MSKLPILRLLQDCEDPPLTAESLERVQREAGVRFPDDYAAFLLQFNGGHFRKMVSFDIPNPTNEYVTGGILEFFFGESFDGKLGLIEWDKSLRNRLPEECFAIAMCNSGDLVVLKYKDLDRTEFDDVWFWDSEALFCDTKPLFWLADSFTDFLSMPALDVCHYADLPAWQTLPLFQLIESGNLTAIERYLLDGGDPNVRNERGESLLAAAVIHTWPAIAGVLLEHSADPNARDQSGSTALHHAATGAIDCLKLLLAKGADVSVRNKKGYSAFDAAELAPRARRILLEHGAEDDARLREVLRAKDSDRISIKHWPDELWLDVFAQPGAKKNAIVSTYKWRLKVAITHTTIKGKANQAIIEVLAEALQVPVSQISVLSGKTTAEKTFCVAGLNLHTARERLGEALAGEG